MSNKTFVLYKRFSSREMWKVENIRENGVKEKNTVLDKTLKKTSLKNVWGRKISYLRYVILYTICALVTHKKI